MTSKIMMSFKFVLSWKVSSGRNKGQEKKETFETKYDNNVSDFGRTLNEIKNQQVEIATQLANEELDEMKAAGGRKKFNVKNVKVARVFDITLRRVKSTDRKDRKDRKEGKYLAPGSYAGSFVLSYGFKVYDTKKQKVDRKSDDIVAINRVIQKGDRLTKEDIVKQAVESYFVDETNSWSNYDGFELGSYDTSDLTFGEEKKSSLDQVPMRQTELAYDFLGDLTNVNKHPGRCVFDYIIYEAARSGMKKYTMPYLVQCFGEQSIEKGITTEAIIDWAKKERYISVHCVDPFLRRFDQHIANDEDRHVKFSLVFICNNMHCYPILDADMRKSVAQKKRIDLEDFTFDVKFEDHAFIPQCSSDQKEMVKKLIEEKKQVIIVDQNNLTRLMTDYMRETKQIIYNIKFNGHRVSAFQVPHKEIEGSQCSSESAVRQVVLTGEAYHERRDLCNRLFEMTKSEMFVFKNQSFTQLSNDYFEATVGKMRKSEYSNDLREIYRKYKVAPYVYQVNEKPAFSSVECFDIKACFTGILINNETPYNIFSSFDVVREFTAKTKMGPGIYFVNRMVKMADGTIVLPRNWYSLVLVKYLLTRGCITKSDITYVLPASNHFAADAFKEFAETLHSLGDKRLVNHFIGNLNKQTQRKTRGVVSDDYDTAMSLLMDEKLNGRNASILTVNDLYHVRSHTTTELSKTHAPIWRHVIESSYIVLDKLYAKVKCDVSQLDKRFAENYNNSTVIAYNTDSIIIAEPLDDCFLKLKTDDLMPGDIRRAEGEPRGHFISEITDNDTYVLNRAPINRVVEDLEFLQENGCLVVGMPGCGKTEMIRRTFTDSSIAFCYTGRGVDVLKKREIKNAYTFDSYFYEMKGTNPIEEIGKYTVIYVDEYSMVPSHFYGILLQIKNRYPSMKFRFFGDANQCRPVEERWYEYYEHPTIMHLVDNNLMELTYKEQFARYDKKLYDVLCYFREHKRLPQTLADRKIKPTPINICYYTATAERVNAECFARYSKGKKIEYVNGVGYYVGMPIVIEKNRKDLDIYNSQIYKIKEITDKHVKIEDDQCGSGGEKVIFRSLFTKDLFKYAYCITVYRYQGGTITDEYSIHDMASLAQALETTHLDDEVHVPDTYVDNRRMMNFNHLYTALSRGVSLDKVHFNYNDLEYEVVKPTTKSIEQELKVSMIDGKIYEITDGKAYYVGSTQKELSERLAEHKIKPVNKHMKDFIAGNVKIRLLEKVCVSSLLELRETEDKYIKRYKDKYGDLLLNCKFNIKGSRNKCVETKITIVQKVDVDRFKIVKDETNKMFRIQYRDENGKKISKKWGYARGEDVAYQKALTYQKELREKYYL